MDIGKIFTFITLLLFLGVFFCSRTGSMLEEHKARWDAVLAQEVPPGMPADALKNWASRRQIQLRETADGFEASVETLKDDSFGAVCRDWIITLHFTLDKQGVVTGSKAKTAGQCL